MRSYRRCPSESPSGGEYCSATRIIVEVSFASSAASLTGSFSSFIIIIMIFIKNNCQELGSDSSDLPGSRSNESIGFCWEDRVEGNSGRFKDPFIIAKMIVNDCVFVMRTVQQFARVLFSVYILAYVYAVS